MDYKETLDYLFAQLPMFSRVGKQAIKKDLTNTIALCEALGNPQNSFKSVHIAGTNGKGSVCHMLAALLQKNGYKTALYTSPHIQSFTERIRINGVEVSKDWVVDFVAQHKQIIEKIKPSFFEITVVMAFKYFAEQKVDLAIIETGLGGRLDSTNVVIPILSIITNIGLDHMDMLGDTLEKIAVEKAGIIKESVPVIISETQAETEAVFFQKAHQMKAPILFADAIYSTSRVGKKYVLVHQGNTEVFSLTLDLMGSYQYKNAQAVLLAQDVLVQNGFALDKDKSLHALTEVKKLTGIKGRFDVQNEQPLIIFDVAHNADGIALTLKELKHYTFDKLHIVCGFVKDKDVQKALKVFPLDATFYFTQAKVPRALSVDKLMTAAHEIGLDGSVYQNVTDAFETAKRAAMPTDAIVVIGSFFILEELY